MDLLVMKYYWNELKNDIPNFHFRLNAIENSKTSFGFLFSASETNATNRELGKFLEKFFDENRDNIDVIVKRSHNYLTKKVREISKKRDIQSSAVAEQEGGNGVRSRRLTFLKVGS